MKKVVTVQPTVIHLAPSRPMKRPKRPAVKALINGKKTINKYIDNDEVREIVELSDSCKNDGIAEICKRLGVAVEMTEDTMLQEMMDEWNELHKMLTFVSDWEIRNNPTIVAEYISGKVKE